MQIEVFALERVQSLYENIVSHNLSDSGVHPYELRSLLSAEEIARLSEIEIGYGWTNGSPGLRQAIAKLYRGRTADEVIVTNGSAEANLLVALTLLDPGDEIVIVVPNYLQLHGWAKAAGVVVKTVALRPENDWKPDFDELDAAVGPRTKLLSICTPNNPTGSILSLDEMNRLVDLCRRNGLWLHADEIYRGSELEGAEPPSFADLYEKALAVGGVSKAMALPGLRIGWIVGPAGKVAEAWARKDYTSITTSALSEHIAEIVLEPSRRQQILERSKAMLRGNLASLVDWVDRNQRFSLCRPKAGGMAFVQYDLPITSDEFADRLRVEHHVLVAPGDVYGLDGYIRIGIGAPEHILTEGLSRITSFASKFS